MKDYNKMADHYFDQAGILKQYPSKKPLREIVLQRIAGRFEPGKDYTEKEINQMLKEQLAFSDVALIRRELIDYAFLNRERDGSRYWKKEPPMEIHFQDIILRDFLESDIEKRILWETEETEWQLWDAPWEHEGLTEAARAEELNRYVAGLKAAALRCRALSETDPRSSFQIALGDGTGRYIGWCNSYDIDETFTYTPGDGLCTVGIDIPDMTARGKGYSYQALYAFISYLMESGEEAVYLQTWSGNERMVHIAAKLGFELCCRKEGIRLVRGRLYDGLTFHLNPEKFHAFGLRFPQP